MHQLALVGIPAAFVAGVVFHKYVVSEAQALRSHVDAAENRIRSDIRVALSKMNL